MSVLDEALKLIHSGGQYAQQNLVQPFMKGMQESPTDYANRDVPAFSPEGFGNFLSNGTPTGAGLEGAAHLLPAALGIMKLVPKSGMYGEKMLAQDVGAALPAIQRFEKNFDPNYFMKYRPQDEQLLRGLVGNYMHPELGKNWSMERVINELKGYMKDIGVQAPRMKKR